MAAIIGGIIAAVGALGAAGMASDQARSSANQASDTNKNGLQLTRSDAAPWRTAGGSAVNRLAQLLGLPSAQQNQNYTPQNLVDTSGGRPQANMQLYVSDPAYKAAWDQQAAEHRTMFGTDYKADSDPAAIANGLQSKLAAAGVFGGNQVGTQGQLTDASGKPIPGGQGDFGSLLKQFTGADLENEPGYKFRLEQGMKGINAQAAARGGFDSGATLKALQRYGQEYAGGEFQNAFNRDLASKQNTFNMLSGVSGTGQVANQALGNANTNVYGANAQNIMTGGMARAQTTLGAAGAVNNAIQSGIGNYYYNQRMNQQQPQPNYGSIGQADYPYGYG